MWGWGGFGHPVKNGAAGARFRLTKLGGCLISVQMMETRWGTLWLRGWEVGNEWHAGVGWFWAPRQKPSRWGSVLANEMWGVTQMHQGGFCEVVEHGVEVVGWHDQVAHKGGLPAKNRATRAWFWLTKSRGYLGCIRVVAMRWQNMGLRWWEGTIERRARGWAGSPQKNRKPSSCSSVFVND